MPPALMRKETAAWLCSGALAVTGLTWRRPACSLSARAAVSRDRAILILPGPTLTWASPGRRYIGLATLHGHSPGATGFTGGGFLPMGRLASGGTAAQTTRKASRHKRPGHHERPFHTVGCSDQRHAARAVSGAGDGRQSPACAAALLGF